MVSIKVKLRESTVRGKVGKLFMQIIYKRQVKTIGTPFKLFDH